MKKPWLVCFVVALLVQPIVYGYGQGTSSKEEAFATSLKLLFDEMTAAVFAGDVESWISLWDKDGVQMHDDSMLVKE